MVCDFFLDIAVGKQLLTLNRQGRILLSYPVSTAKNGLGQLRGSECTPAGWHSVRAKIGANFPLGAVFVGRRPTGEIYDANLGRQFPERDWILTRILWLGGLEPGKNRYGSVDTAWRYIYIHGCPDHLIDGSPQSHGCIRMKNGDIADLFGRIEAGTRIFIHE